MPDAMAPEPTPKTPLASEPAPDLGGGKPLDGPQPASASATSASSSSSNPAHTLNLEPSSAASQTASVSVTISSSSVSASVPSSSASAPAAVTSSLLPDMAELAAIEKANNEKGPVPRFIPKEVVATRFRTLKHFFKSGFSFITFWIIFFAATFMTIVFPHVLDEHSWSLIVLMVVVSLMFILVTVSLAMLWWADPGYIKPGFVPPDVKIPDMSLNELKNYSFLDGRSFCVRCQCYRAPMSHHCSQCERCVRRFDHHCYILERCVAERTHRWFLGMLVAIVVGCTCVVLGCVHVIVCDGHVWYAWVIISIAAIPIIVFTYVFFCQLKNSIDPIRWSVLGGYPTPAHLARAPSFCHALLIMCFCPAAIDYVANPGECETQSMPLQCATKQRQEVEMTSGGAKCDFVQITVTPPQLQAAASEQQPPQQQQQQQQQQPSGEASAQATPVQKEEEKDKKNTTNTSVASSEVARTPCEQPDIQHTPSAASSQVQCNSSPAKSVEGVSDVKAVPSSLGAAQV